MPCLAALVLPAAQGTAAAAAAGTRALVRHVGGAAEALGKLREATNVVALQRQELQGALTGVVHRLRAA